MYIFNKCYDQILSVQAYIVSIIQNTLSKFKSTYKLRVRLELFASEQDRNYRKFIQYKVTKN